MKKTLIWVGAITLLAGVGMYLKTQYDLSMKVGYTYTNFKLNYASKDKLTIDFDLNIKNEGELELDITKIDIDVYANEVYATRIFSDKELVIKPNSTGSVKMQIILNPSSIIRNINQLAFGANSLGDMRLKFKGKIKVRKFGINIPIPFVYSTTYKELMGS